MGSPSSKERDSARPFEKRFIPQLQGGLQGQSPKNSYASSSKHIKAGKTVGLRIFRATDLKARPESITWAKEALKDLKLLQDSQ
ncbi:MAG: hypothetical protein L0387_18120 [Acidobacteria bacterium]|nr:hypothetical protein [Acidobacteriota bacterium]MCI0623546.1 hypothetical protein [Acidobacteriota bacterium]MCI0719114.1 hypothetical protein [Acidobacteriota bacterium]